MAIHLRSVTDDDAPALVRTASRAFGARVTDSEDSITRLRTGFELDRFLGAYDGDEMVGQGGAYTMELTLPGLQTVPVSGVTWIAVLPTHRRRGVMTMVMEALVADARVRGEVAMVLIASEGGIYSNVGYGAATKWQDTQIDVRRAHVRAEGRPSGRVRFVDGDDALDVLPAVHDRVRSCRAGELSRSERWWRSHVTDGPRRISAFVVAEDDHGVAQGYAAYNVTERWGTGHPNHLCELEFLGAATDEASHALWSFLLSLDLVGELQTVCVAPDDPLSFWIDDPRQVRTVDMNDALWVRLLDVPAVFGARRYQVADEIVLEVTGDVEHVSGRWRLTGGPEYAACAPSTSPPDIRLSSETLAAISLGASPVHQHARAGRIVEMNQGAIDRLARFLRWDPTPYCATNF